MVDEHTETVAKEVDETVVGSRVEALRALVNAPDDVLASMRDVLSINEREEGWRGIINRLHSLEGVPGVGKVAMGVANLLVGSLVRNRTQHLEFQGMARDSGLPRQ